VTKLFHAFKVVTHFMAYYIKILKSLSSAAFEEFNTVTQKLAYCIKNFENYLGCLVGFCCCGYL